MTSRRRLRGTSSLKRRTTPREPEPIRPEDYATAAKPIGVCRACHHHTSAFAGRCTAMVPGVERLLVYCGCDCREHLNGDPTRDREPDAVLAVLRQIKSLNDTYNRGEITLDEWSTRVAPLIKQAETAQQDRDREETR